MMACAASTSAAQQPAQWMVGVPPVIEVDETWLENLQVGTARIGRCAAALVTATGLMATSYTCARRHVRTAWSIEHVPLDDGFYAQDLFDERHVPGLYADHLVSVHEVGAGAPADSTWEDEEGLMIYEVRAVEDSARFLAYAYRRYGDVRVVMMPERSVATFGGDPDEGTYPRYSLGFGFLRAYDQEGHPVVTESYLPLSGAGVTPGQTLYSVGIREQVPWISTGTVEGYAYNGTWAPPYTTLFGLYDLHFSHGAGTPWEMPASWLADRQHMDLSVQLSAVSTVLCPGSGAPLVNKDLEVMAIAFDRVSAEDAWRCIGVTGAGIYEVLRNHYDAGMLVAELDEEGLDEYAE